MNEKIAAEITLDANPTCPDRCEGGAGVGSRERTSDSNRTIRDGRKHQRPVSDRLVRRCGQSPRDADRRLDLDASHGAGA